MKNELVHFAIYTDDLKRAKGFYSGVFEWDFNAYGPSDFAQITHRDGGEIPIGALQSRQYSPIGEKIIGLEGSISVEDINDTIAKVEAFGGAIVMPKTAIPNVGWICKFKDTEGNLLCAVQYDQNAKG
ncbi:VOC family protein [Roseivirga sp.]|uniref:VOC family protein n=1 Tax=Roseivirga sp. TaxID=1964215 RepID=UPI003B523700